MPDALLIRGRPSRSAAVALLATAGLPVLDLTDGHLEHFFYTGPDGSPTALVGLELYGADALLRSLVVVPDARTKGVGSAIVRHAEEYAASRHVHAVYLLTTTAESFFERLGYRRVDRTQAPPSIQSTREFASLCPASSAFLFKQLSSITGTAGIT
jgi:amino-acid N-acetyltransferase